MTIETININPIHRNQSEIIISWESGETTKLLFGDAYPLQVKEYYIKAIYDMVEQNKDIESFDELVGLFFLWFVRCNLIMPLTVATFYGEERKRIGARIKAIREGLNMEAKRLSQITGIDAANISRIEQGKLSAGVDTIAKIANALGYKLDFVKLNNNLPS
ncbi:MAG: helix-turn-helix transcriptional regulator [Muribaculaceae bacterium]|nr:helix-turn-helix transcriptional regulator [Muribaculaceae bacterium]